MRIPSYQIHNVLKLYSEQLMEIKKGRSVLDIGSGPIFDDKSVFAGGKHRDIIEKTTAKIIEKITRFDLQINIDHKIESLAPEKPAGSLAPKDPDETQFVFNRINTNNDKTTTMLSVENPDFVIKRLEKQIAAAVNSKKQENL